MDGDCRKIWWIASFPKSGNTWVRMFLNAYVTRFPIDINAHYQYATIDQNVNYYHAVSAKPISECSETEIVYLRPAMLVRHLHEIAPRDACFKTHHACLELDRMPLIPPKLTKGALYLIRDSRDVAISYAKHCNTSIDRTIEAMGSVNHYGNRKSTGLMDYVSSWSMHVRTWTEHDKFPVKVVRYEDLLSSPEHWFREALDGLGFRQVDEAAFQFALEQTQFVKLKEQESSKGFKERHGEEHFFRTGKSGQWREVLSEEQKRRIETEHREVMEEFGYGT